MLSNGQERFLTYYHRELTYLREAGQLFAKKHPKIARRLSLSLGESADPHTERLLESFSFMTARLHQEIDDRLPQISSALLEILYPHLIAPVPSMSVAQFVVDPTKGKLTSGAYIPRYTSLVSLAEEGVACQFRTAYPVTLWPIALKKACFTQVNEGVFIGGHKDTWYLHLQLEAINLEFDDLDLTDLRFYIDGDAAIRFRLYDMIFGQEDPPVYVKGSHERMIQLPEKSLHHVGFLASEGILPAPPHAHPAYQLVHEYLNFPEKFLFFDIKNLKNIGKGNFLDIYIPLSQVQDIEKFSINPNNFRLGCTPIVNLFSKISDPLRLTHQKFDYRLIPDQRRERTTEIYGIEKITYTQDHGQTSQNIPPYFSFEHDVFDNSCPFYWVARRAPSTQRDVPGTEVSLTFVDLAFNPKNPTDQIIFAHTLCTNRFLAEQIPEGGVFQAEEAYPVQKIVCLMKPTPQRYTPQDGETLWQLVSQLSLNHLSLSGGEAAVKALKETLMLYGGRDNEVLRGQIQSIQDLQCIPVVRRVGREAWRGFFNGLRITLTLDERSYSGESAIIFANVLRHFFALHASANSFIELHLRSQQREREWISWTPLQGDQAIL